jgi:hypothetical protein
MTPVHRRWGETPYDTRALDFDDLALDVEPDDRVGAPLPNRHRSKLRTMFVGIVLIAGAWTLVARDPEMAHGLVDSALSLLDGVVSKAREIASRQGQETASVPAAVANASAGPTEPLAPVEQNSGPEPASSLAQAENAAAASGGDLSTGSIGAAYAERSEPAEEAPDKSPKRAHAIAAGLSPDLPNVLLSRLSDADLKNARYAIKTALAKTPDAASFAWPPAPSRQQALFEIRFVAGASPGCRRYIVTVSKDRWSSTAAAQEKCGETIPRAG